MVVRMGWKRFVMVVIAAGMLGLAVAWAGVIDVSASSGHWKATDWFLHWVMRNSVRTHSLGVTVPDLGDPAMIRRGAGHYATGCAPCHGAPGEERNPVVLRQTPPPPTLDDPDKWRDRELFWVVKHGVKFTAMPSWVAGARDDEVWDVVAFLRALPDLAPDDYRRLAHGEERPAGGAGGAAAALDRLSRPAGGSTLADCARCHGRDGAGRDGSGYGDDAFPSLAGQSEIYLRDSLAAYAEGRRHSGMMQPAAARADPAEWAALAAHYAAQPPAAPPTPVADTSLLDAGAAIARAGLPTQGVPACLSCHDAAGRARNPAFPRLDGQHPDYLANQLRLWRDDARGGGPYAHLMQLVARRLTPGQVEAVAAYFAARGRHD